MRTPHGQTAFVLVLAALSAPLCAVDFHVDSSLDHIDDDVFDGICHTAANTCTLRAAVMQAGVISGAGARIFVPAGTYLLTRPAVGANGPDSGDLNLTTPDSGNPVIEIVGAGVGATIVDANGLDRAFRVNSGRTAILRDLTIRNGFAIDGAGIQVEGLSTALERVDIRDNTASTRGGGIWAWSGQLTVLDSTIRDNFALDGGGIFSGGSLLRVERSTISGNFASSRGGGIFDESGFSGGVIINSTLSDNRANEEGGGLFSFSYTQFFSSTIAFNRADDDDNGGEDGGGVYLNPFFVEYIDLHNSLVAGNVRSTPPVPSDCNFVYTYERNLLGSTDGCFINGLDESWDLLNSLALLGPLAANGGPTQTHALLEGSNAIDGGNPEGCAFDDQPMLYDQRRFDRHAGADCDVGSYEFGSAPVNAILLDGFESGGIGAWSNVQGLPCPVVPGSFGEEVGVLASPTPGSRVVFYEGGHLVSDVETVLFAKIELYEAFGGPMEPDTVDLDLGGNGNYATCGTCVLLYQDRRPDGSAVRTFFQQSGTLTLTALTPTAGGSLSGTVNAILEEVTIDPGTFQSTPVPGGCVIPVTFSFSTTIE